ncbi:hypothetical protein HDU98_003535 [Podochytrium sp. JEL0797]|nr:hypothetical protein HDU98_003535 [Podochytrium sp. JEL0797]
MSLFQEFCEDPVSFLSPERQEPIFDNTDPTNSLPDSMLLNEQDRSFSHPLLNGFQGTADLPFPHLQPIHQFDHHRQQFFFQDLPQQQYQQQEIYFTNKHQRFQTSHPLSVYQQDGFHVMNPGGGLFQLNNSHNYLEQQYASPQMQMHYQQQQHLGHYGSPIDRSDSIYSRSDSTYSNFSVAPAMYNTDISRRPSLRPESFLDAHHANAFCSEEPRLFDHSHSSRFSSPFPEQAPLVETIQGPETTPLPESTTHHHAFPAILIKFPVSRSNSDATLRSPVLSPIKRSSSVAAASKSPSPATPPSPPPAATTAKTPALPPARRVGGSTKKRLSLLPEQVEVLNDCFAKCRFLNPGQAVELSELLGMTPVQVRIWFQNKRAYKKRKGYRRSKQARGERNDDEDEEDE